MDSLTMELPLLLVLDKVIDDPGVRVVQVFQGYRRVRIVILVVLVHWLLRDGPSENLLFSGLHVVLVMRALPQVRVHIVILVVQMDLPRTHFTVFAAPRGTVLVVDFLRWYSSTGSIGTCVRLRLDWTTLFPLHLCGRLAATMVRCPGSLWCSGEGGARSRASEVISLGWQSTWCS